MSNILELSGDLLSLSVPGGIEKIAALWFARGDVLKSKLLMKNL